MEDDGDRRSQATRVGSGLHCPAAQGVPAVEQHTPDFAKRVGPEGSTPETRRFGGIQPGNSVASEGSTPGIASARRDP